MDAIACLDVGCGWLDGCGRLWTDSWCMADSRPMDGSWPVGSRLDRGERSGGHGPGSGVQARVVQVKSGRGGRNNEQAAN